MKHRTQRWLNRFLFCGCVLLPSLVIAGTLILRHTDTGQRWMLMWWTDAFAQATASQVEIGRVHFVGPDRYVFENVRLSDRETGRHIIQCDHVALNRINAQWELVIHTADTPYPDLYGWMQWWNGHVLSQKEGPETHIRIDKLSLGDPQKRQLQNFNAQVMPGSDVTELLVNFGGDVKEPIALRVRRPHIYPVQTEIVLKTNAQRLPINVLGDLLEFDFQFGKVATFSGEAVVQISSQPADRVRKLTLKGELNQVDLTQLLQNAQPPPMVGMVQVAVMHAEYDDGQWIRLEGRLQGEPGHVQRAWLPTVARSLKLRWLGDLDQSSIPYESLCCEFLWSPEGISIRGEKDGPNRGSILRHAQGIILADDPEQVIQTTAIQDVLLR